MKRPLISCLQHVFIIDLFLCCFQWILPFLPKIEEASRSTCLDGFHLFVNDWDTRKFIQHCCWGSATCAPYFKPDDTAACLIRVAWGGDSPVWCNMHTCPHGNGPINQSTYRSGQSVAILWPWQGSQTKGMGRTVMKDNEGLCLYPSQHTTTSSRQTLLKNFHSWVVFGFRVTVATTVTESWSRTKSRYRWCCEAPYHGGCCHGKQLSHQGRGPGGW